MPISRAAFVETFGQAVLAGNAAIFVGAGLSRAAGYPDWGSLLAPMQERCSIPAHRDLPLVAEFIALDAANGGRDALESHILTTITGIDPVPSSSHVDLGRLDVKELWTTNYDRLLETAIPEAVVVAAEQSVHNIASRRRAIIKMHGSINSADQWELAPIITRSDYERYETEHPRIWTVLRSSYMSRTILFLGFSFTDPNIEILLRLARTLGTASGDKHLAVMKPPNGPNDSAEDMQRYRLQAADLENSGISICEVDSHEEIRDVTAELVLRTRPPHLFISGSSNIKNATDSQNEEILEPWCAAIATMLVDEPDWTITSLGGPAGWYTSRNVARTRRKEQDYDPSKIVIHFRGKNEPPEVPPERVGTAIYSDLTREQLVHSLLDECRSLLAISGGTRTAEEIEWAVQRRVAVVPLAAAGGAAREYWAKHRDDPPAIGSRPTDRKTWALLDDSDHTVAARAAKRLLKQAMYESEGTS
ncbi:unannotated protein [freshwater metagenome]|uniref:Unannotated protein n=1 Tax=freshwater metagenome TaxID=449393 RepID=A0A6J7F1B9_9ZZZZ|nr:SIR2 family protein [Actinomycetota bacterium]